MARLYCWAAPPPSMNEMLCSKLLSPFSPPQAVTSPTHMHKITSNHEEQQIPVCPLGSKRYELNATRKKVSKLSLHPKVKLVSFVGGTSLLEDGILRGPGTVTSFVWQRAWAGGTCMVVCARIWKNAGALVPGDTYFRLRARRC